MFSQALLLQISIMAGRAASCHLDPSHRQHLVLWLVCSLVAVLAVPSNSRQLHAWPRQTWAVWHEKHWHAVIEVVLTCLAGHPRFRPVLARCHPAVPCQWAAAWCFPTKAHADRLQVSSLHASRLVCTTALILACTFWEACLLSNLSAPARSMC